MFCGKMKAVTFSYDDGVTQDLKLIEILNRYGLKATFNLNSGKFGDRFSNCIEGILVYRDKVFAHDVRAIYEGHEVASHTVDHPDLTRLSDEEIVSQIEEDRKCLSELVDYEIRGLAYPMGYVDERVVSVIREKTNIRYARGVGVTGDFMPQSDPYNLSFTTRNFGERFLELAKEFVELKADEPRIFSVWGHAYEFDWKKNWHVFEEFCKIISGHDDIFYGTNSDVFLRE